MLTVKEKKAKVLFDNMELFILREALTYANPFYDEQAKENFYQNYGIVIGDDWNEKQIKLRDKIEHIFEASREFDFEGFEYR